MHVQSNNTSKRRLKTRHFGCYSEFSSVIPEAHTQTLPQASQISPNFQQEQHQSKLQLHGKHENHHHQAQQENPQHQPRHHPCRKKDQCPLNNNCLSSSIIYNAHVTTNEDTTGKNYIGLQWRIQGF